MALHRSLALALLAAATLLGGCVYRPDIQQGNLLTVEDTDQVQVGMTRSQVRFLLGTPMISDPFAPHRWDYVYRMQYGRGGRVDSAHFVVFFEDDKVVRVETRGRPVPTAGARRGRTEEAEGGARRRGHDRQGAAAGPRGRDQAAGHTRTRHLMPPRLAGRRSILRCSWAATAGRAAPPAARLAARVARIEPERPVDLDTVASPQRLAGRHALAVDAEDADRRAAAPPARAAAPTPPPPRRRSCRRASSTPTTHCRSGRA